MAYKTDKIIAISNSEYKSALEKNICSNNKITLIENGIDVKKFSYSEDNRKQIRKKYGIKDEAIVIGIVGRISEQKDPLTSIRAANELIKENKKIYFMFVRLWKSTK